ncbi:hypothetical protein C7212DRAFT_360261 [Tuber magnatum]|uniref:Peripheral subunit-binding (PSBD) domain-containing protein n=1 Tax=Tuber magnatum TaxID=42249 RepID=A0A317SF38_9PEZI|nr:hypothetical protein C7212DRAFT_360261 [Tuber magnatum]
MVRGVAEVGAKRRGSRRRKTQIYARERRRKNEGAAGGVNGAGEGRVDEPATTACRNVASNYRMPVLSPTTTEGTITRWKLNGCSQIVVLAELSGDLASLEVLQEKGTEGGSGALARKEKVDEKSSEEDTMSARREGRPSVMESSAESAPDTAGIAKEYTPSPSVAHLIRKHKISKVDVSAVDATGSEGRIHKLEKLDLTNIKIASRKKGAGENAKQVVEGKPAINEKKELKLELSFGEVLRSQPPTPHCVTSANIFGGLPNFPAMISSQPNKFQPKTTDSFPPPLHCPAAGPGILNILTSTAPATSPAKLTPGITATYPNMISLTVKSAIEEVQGNLFLEKVKSSLEKDPGGPVF